MRRVIQCRGRPSLVRLRPGPDRPRGAACNAARGATQRRGQGAAKGGAMSTSDLALKISTEIARDIAAGELGAGDHVRSQAIADRYQVSRTPVREALESLHRRGFIEHRPNRGYFVAETVPQEEIDRLEDQAPDDHDTYQRFAEDWLTDELPEVVTEKALRERYGLTRSRIADMLARAGREGWAESREGYGWRLLPVAKTPEAFDQIYRFRMAIEPIALLEPGFELDRAALDEQKRIQSRLLEGGIDSLPAERLVAAGAEFHEAICRMSGNPFFLTGLERVNRMRRLLEYRTLIDRERIAVQSSQHLELIGLLERGEVVEASYFMRRHLSGALRRKSPAAWRWSKAAQAGG